MRWIAGVTAGIGMSTGLLLAQSKPFESQSQASVAYSIKDGQQTVEITDAGFEVTGTAVPGRPQDERLLIRTMTHTKQVVDEIGMLASTTVEAWPLGVDPKQKPLYTLKVDGVDPRIVDNALLVILRGLEETEWWSVYQLGSGERLFDSYVPLVSFSIRRGIQTTRYAGYENPGDDVRDQRLKDPHVVGVLTYASAKRVLREVLITSDDAKRAQMLRSFADDSRALAIVEAPGPALKLSISQNYPSAPATVSVTIPVVKDDLDISHANIPAGLHLALFQR